MRKPCHPGAPRAYFLKNPAPAGDVAVKNAILKATDLVVLTALLYRELATSALNLLPGRRPLEEA